MSQPIQFGIALASNSGGRFSPRGEYREYSATFKPERERDAVEYFRLGDTGVFEEVVLKTREEGDTLSITVNGDELNRPGDMVKALQLVGSSNAEPLARQTMAEIISSKLQQTYPKNGFIKAMEEAAGSTDDVFRREATCQALAQMIATFAD